MPTMSKDERAKMAKHFITRVIPSVLASNRRARLGVASARVVADPRFSPSNGRVAKEASAPLNVKMVISDTLEAASVAASTASSRPRRQPRVAVLNMASALRPGGGVLTGATSQEEWLCARTTLYPSLREDFYRLPEVGGIYTPDVLVCRTWDDEARNLPLNERFFVDVITAAMVRQPDVDVEEGEAVYSEQKDRDLVLQKMRAVMRIAHSNGVERLVLGAWGCGAYANPVGEVARAWKRVLLGGTTPKQVAEREAWKDIEVVFAIKDVRTAESFSQAFGSGLVRENTCIEQ